MSVIDYLVSRLRRGIITFLNAVILSNVDFPYDDHLKDTTTSTAQSYQVGKNNMVGRGDQRKLFISKDTAIFCTTDTYVIFNSAENTPHYLRANTWYCFERNVFVVHYYYVSAEGTIYFHFEGVLPNEGRVPE